MKKLIEVVDEAPYLSSSSFHQYDRTNPVIRETILDASLLEQGLCDRLNDWIERYYRECIHLTPPLT